MSKIVIYQVFPRYFGNSKTSLVPNGTMEENGCGKLNDFTPVALSAIRSMGFSHIWFTGILEHATQTNYSAYGILRDHPAIVKGKAGSPYAIKDYYDVDPDLAEYPENRLQEFQALLARCHDAGLKVILDFVPNHVARQYHSDARPMGVRDFGVDDRTDYAFDPDNNFYYLPNQKFAPEIDCFAGCEESYREYPARATGNDCFSASPGIHDWYETVKLNYGVDYQGGSRASFHTVPGTWFKMLDILSYWVNMGVDGFRCDMAEMVPVEFWGWVIPRVKKMQQSVLFIAEVYQPNRYRDFLNIGCFDYLYDKEGLYNTLRAVTEGHASASAITGCWQFINGIQARMLNFLENHDEQRIASDFFAGDAFKGFPAMMVLACMQTNPLMIYSGQELGERGMYAEGFSGLDGRSSIFDYWSLETLVAWNNGGKWNEEKLSDRQRRIRAFYSRLLSVCAEEKCINEGAFFDLMYANLDNPGFNASKVYAFMRKAGGECLLALANFSGEMQRVNLNVPRHAFDCLEIPDGCSVTMKNLFNGETKVLEWSSRRPIFLELSGYGYVLWKAVFS
jgi:glycosidase